MSGNWEKYRRTITLLFCVSLIGLGLHVLDDALVTREPDWYGISVGEFLFYCALIYLFVPPVGLALLRRANMLGFAITVLYTLQALYGAGINHVKHLFGSFQGSGLLPALLKSLNVDYAPYLTGHGFLSLILNMAGLGITPPHTHMLASDLVVFFNIGLNLVLLLNLALAARELWAKSSPHAESN